MTLTSQQLATVLSRALPGAQLRESRALAGDRYALGIANGERLSLHLYSSPSAAATALEALRLLRGEIDLPIPQLRANDADGETIGVPYLLLGDMSGEPLESALPRINDDQLYKLGRRLGETICRVHRLISAHYGQLHGETIDGDDERDYVLARLARDIPRYGELGLLDRKTGSALTDWFAREFKPAGRQPALVHGGLSPRAILVREGKSGWVISGLLGWEAALGWSPAWDHVHLLDTTEEPRFFGLRVGYGNGYDEQTTRTYEQVREHALAPYRMLLVLQRMRTAYANNDLAELDRRRAMLRGFMRFLA